MPLTWEATLASSFKQLVICAPFRLFLLAPVDSAIVMWYAGALACNANSNCNDNDYCTVGRSVGVIIIHVARCHDRSPTIVVLYPFIFLVNLCCVQTHATWPRVLACLRPHMLAHAACWEMTYARSEARWCIRVAAPACAKRMAGACM